MKLQKNVRGKERLIRGVAGLGLMGAAALAPVGGRWKGVLAAIGSDVLATATSGYCPINAKLGRGTRTGWLRFVPGR